MTRPRTALRISWSQLKAHEECRQKAHLMRAGKGSPAKNLRNYYHGMVVDRVMRQWLTNPVPGAMPGMVQAAIDEGIEEARDSGDGVVRWKHATDRAEVAVYCTDLVTRLEPLLDRLVLRYPYESALRFKETVLIPDLDGVPTEVHLVGEMDLLVQTPGGFWILDLKGTADDQYWRRCVGQLVFYDLAVLARHRQRSQCVGLIQPMCTQPTVAFTVTEDQRKELWARLVKMCQQIWAADFACKDGTAGCTWCDVRHACVRYAPTADNTMAFGLREAAKGLT